VRGVEFDTVVNGITRALAKARDSFGLTSRLILCFLRHLSEASAQETLRETLAHRDAIVAVRLDSSQLGHPPEKFAEVFARARAEGFRAVAHAGEEGPAAYLRDALDLLQVTRIDHGNNALDDEALTRRIVALGSTSGAMPEPSTALVPGDEILFCGRERAVRLMDATTADEYTLRYLMTGAEAPRGHVMR
jgi:adenine deaminase